VLRITERTVHLHSKDGSEIASIAVNERNRKFFTLLSERITEECIRNRESGFTEGKFAIKSKIADRLRAILVGLMSL